MLRNRIYQCAQEEEAIGLVIYMSIDAQAGHHL